MNKALLAAIAATALAMSGGGYAYWQNLPTTKAKRALAERMKDPDSVKFSGVTRCGGNLFYTPTWDFVYGYVNAKNEFGAYTGRTMFMADVNEDGSIGYVKTADERILGSDVRRLEAALAKGMDCQTAYETWPDSQESDDSIGTDAAALDAYEDQTATEPTPSP